MAAGAIPAGAIPVGAFPANAVPPYYNPQVAGQYNGQQFGGPFHGAGVPPTASSEAALAATSAYEASRLLVIQLWALMTSPIGLTVIIGAAVVLLYVKRESLLRFFHDLRWSFARVEVISIAELQKRPLQFVFTDGNGNPYHPALNNPPPQPPVN